MQNKNKLLLFLLLFPTLVELVTGSTPILFFLRSPFTLITFILTYGLCTLLIREARTRWNLQWSIVFLAMVFPIFLEGFFMQSFFNIGHEDLGSLSNFGMYFGIQWPWTISLIFFHTTISILIPLFIADSLWPELKTKSLLKIRGIMLSFAGITAITILMFLKIMKISPMYAQYIPNKGLILATVAAMIFFIYLAYIYRNSRITFNGKIMPPSLFFILGFLFQAINLLMPHIMADNGKNAEFVLCLQFLLLLFVILFSYRQIYNTDITNQHLTLLVLGNIFFFNVIVFATSFFDIQKIEPTTGMAAVSIIAVILLLIWRTKQTRQGL